MGAVSINTVVVLVSAIPDIMRTTPMEWRNRLGGAKIITRAGIRTNKNRSATTDQNAKREGSR